MKATTNPRRCCGECLQLALDLKRVEQTIVSELTPFPDRVIAQAERREIRRKMRELGCVTTKSTPPATLRSVESLDRDGATAKTIQSNLLLRATRRKLNIIGRDRKANGRKTATYHQSQRTLKYGGLAAMLYPELSNVPDADDDLEVNPDTEALLATVFDEVEADFPFEDGLLPGPLTEDEILAELEEQYGINGDGDEEEEEDLFPLELGVGD